MTRILPDPTFYATPQLAMEAPPESLAYVALLATDDNQRDALGVDRPIGERRATECVRHACLFSRAREAATSTPPARRGAVTHGTLGDPGTATVMEAGAR